MVLRRGATTFIGVAHLAVYNGETQIALSTLVARIDADAVAEVWTALSHRNIWTIRVFLHLDGIILINE
jgi:hypothetical protein